MTLGRQAFAPCPASRLTALRPVYWDKLTSIVRLVSGLAASAWPQKVAAARLSYNCDTLFGMERAISIRLDDDAQHALRVLTKSGRSQSEAVREALIALARSRRRADLANEAERLNADRGDRAEKKKIAKMMESLRAAG